MTFKPFFVHQNRSVSKHDNSRLRHAPRGFTLYVTPSSLREVSVRGTWCSSKDEFKKKEGRELAMAADVAVLNVRELPSLVRDMAAKCEIEDADYSYLLKYVL